MPHELILGIQPFARHFFLRKQRFIWAHTYPPCAVHEQQVQHSPKIWFTCTKCPGNTVHSLRT